MMRSARRIDAHSETLMIGDRMDTDVIAGSRPACDDPGQHRLHQAGPGVDVPTA